VAPATTGQVAATVFPPPTGLLVATGGGWPEASAGPLWFARIGWEPDTHVRGFPLTLTLATTVLTPAEGILHVEWAFAQVAVGRRAHLQLEDLL